MGTPADQLPGVLVAYLDSLNTEDWDRLRSLWRPDARLRAVGTRVRSGPDDILSYFRSALGPWREHRDEATRVLVCGDAITVELHFTGRTEGGLAVSFDAVDVFDLRDGRIAALSSWYDIADVRSRLAGR
jgi:ketosteroid isomerase-like protein